MPGRSNLSFNKMSEYERDLTYMAMRYAIGRSTISCVHLSKEIAKQVYNRMTDIDKVSLAIDIRRQMEEHLNMMPFSFSMSFNIPRNSSDYEPFDKFIEWMEEDNIESPEDLRLWKEIRYLGETQYEAIRANNYEDRYVTNSFNDLINWNHLAKLLDIHCHKYCIVVDENYGYKPIEYFETYILSSISHLSYKKVKVSVEEYMKNPYVLVPISEDGIIKDNLTQLEAFNT